MEPTPATPQPTAPGQSLVEYVRTNRQNAAIGLAALAVLFLAATVFLALRGFRTPQAPEQPAATEPRDPDEPPELPKTPQTPAQIQNQYHLGWIGSLMAFLVVATAAAWLLAGPPPADEAKQRTEARVLILTVGGVLGIILVFNGLLFFYLWRDSLAAWLSRGEVRESKWVLIPVLTMVLGAGLVFLAVQPARAEERNNPRLRRLVYGSNLGLTVLLLLIVLAVTNVVFAMRVPNELDTTASGFYSLTDETRALARRIDPPVTIYAVVPEGGRVLGDVRQLLLALEDAGAGRIKTKFINPGARSKDLADLISRHPQLDVTLADRQLGRLGALVLAVGPAEKPSKIVPVPELFAGNTFAGESRLFNELTLLADNQVKPVVYFTQSNGELSVSAADEDRDDKNASRLRRYLEKLYLDVRPLELAGTNPSVPDDASLVIVAAPQRPFEAPAVEALRKYMNTPRGEGGKKGKLIVLAGVSPGLGGKGVVRTGLEGLLGELNVRLGGQYVYSFTGQLNPEPLVVPAGFMNTAVRHPVAVNLIKAAPTLPMALAREVAPLNGNPALRATALMGAATATWLEENEISYEEAESTQEALEMREKEGLRRDKQHRENGRPLAVVVSEGETPRAAVFGSAVFVSDLAARNYPPDRVPYTIDLIGETVGWLREKPSAAAVEIKAKQYQEYKFPERVGVSATRLLYLPLVVGLLAVVGLGVGVWVARRK